MVLLQGPVPDMTQPVNQSPGFAARLKQRLLRNERSLAKDQSGLAVLEFALILPIFVSLGMYGLEIANMAMIQMQVSQMALSVADNASRLGQSDNSAVTPTVSETDVDSVMFGAMKQGATINFQTNGRIILSSLERDAFTGKQYIHWQRCKGNLTGQSSIYGNDSGNNGLGAGQNITGVGGASGTVTALANSAVMVAEVYYRYNGVFGTMFTDRRVYRQQANLIIRDNRNLTPTGVADGLTGNTIASCA